MLVIGLCGASGSGKGTVSAILRKHNIPCLDTDELYHRLIDGPSACTNDLMNEFGAGILTENGGIDRKILADIVFLDESGDKHEKLNEITHYHIHKETLRWIEKHRTKQFAAVCIDAPMLFESHFDRDCDVTVAVIADDEIKIDRIEKRDHISESKAKMRLSHQISDKDLVEKCDFSLQNSDTVKALEVQVERLIEKLLH